MNFIKFTVLSLLITLGGCAEEDKNVIADVENPETVAIAFFDALYNEKNLKKAASVCEPKLARIILHYKSTKAVARHLFNMSYDKVEVTPDDSGVKVRERFKDKAVITLFFDGYYLDDHLKDVKRLSLVQINDTWVIDKILKDPF